jgi:hypothetical protein
MKIGLHISDFTWDGGAAEPGLLAKAVTTLDAAKF